MFKILFKIMFKIMFKNGVIICKYKSVEVIAKAK